jgi:uncharacterized protein (DUF924 family)
MTGHPFPQALAVVDFWREAGASKWFMKDSDFDAEFSRRFTDLHFEAARRRLESWLADPNASLALILLLDQFPRNAFRDTGHMFATDGLARHYARIALERGHVQHLPADLALFLCVPFIHSEALADQDYGVALYREHSPANLRHAVEHRDIIVQFGRFPHRNVLLGRESTQEEIRFLDQGGFAG